MKKSIYLSVLLLLMIFSSSNLYAVKVSPVRYDLSIARGQSSDYVINLMGTKGLANQRLMIFASDLSMTTSGALLFDRIKGNPNSAVPWINFKIKKLNLLESQSKQIKFKISVPYSAAPGEYYAVIMVEPVEYTTTRDKERNLALKMKTRVAVVVIINVPGRIYIKKGLVDELKISSEKDVITIKSIFKNAGTIHLDVKGEVTVRSKDGRINYGRFPLKAQGTSKETAFVFPGNKRAFEFALDKPMPSGEYMFEVVYDFGYRFKKAASRKFFTIKRKKEVDESKSNFVFLKETKYLIQIPEKGRRSQIINLSNTDYRPLEIELKSKDGIIISPSKVTLAPGKSKNIRATISIKKYNKTNRKEGTIEIIPNRGKKSYIKIIASKNKLKVKK